MEKRLQTQKSLLLDNSSGWAELGQPRRVSREGQSLIERSLSSHLFS